MKTLNIIGCGRLGKTLGRLWQDAGRFRIQQVLNRSVESAGQAVAFIGAGRAIGDWSELEAADCIMLSAADHALADCAAALARTGRVRPGTIVFHCSGSLPAAVLGGLADQGALIASLHPVKSFAAPALAAASFVGTWCGIEGDPAACAVLSAAVEACGASVFSLSGGHKTLYHAGSVIVCNYLVALTEAGLRCFEQAGVGRDQALQIIRPIMDGTLSNLMHLGTAQALTGPIARGEAATVEQQCRSLAAFDPRIAAIYRALGRLTLDLSREQGTAPGEALERLAELLGDPGCPS